MKKENALVALALAAILSAPAAAQTPDAPKPAAESTRAANAAFGKAYDLASQQDFEDAARGLVAQLPAGSSATTRARLSGICRNSASSAEMRRTRSTRACGGRKSSTTAPACSR
jgi:hypothetical protein